MYSVIYLKRYIFREEKFDAVFLQSVWYRQDYDMLKDCLEDLYWVSDFDKNCPSVKEETDQVPKIRESLLTF